MKIAELREQLKGFLIFSLNDIRKVEPKFYSPRLVEWQKKGYIKKIRRGYYSFSDQNIDEETLFLIANRLYSPSYVSLESALSHYGLIPEGVYSITSVSVRKTVSFQTPLAHFTYRHLKTSLHFGYRIDKLNGQGYKIAEMEKAVLDYLYLNPKITDDADYHEWRFNGREFTANMDEDKLRRYATEFGNRRLMNRLEKLLKMIKTQ
ncbi:hypothetical protein JW899_01205 [Candidatus Uhrbacteria bacterium]|nr:hypothetical protein [Candidatus Uhrbacteria bacterium]